MAEPFQPKFVDLVRNSTATTGTGNIVLGAAVAGFTSFASAVQPGESFYYSVIGVDKPAEREVGRGTMQADGTILREPISGAKTSFSNGTKTIALIAAAEWFNQVQESGGSVRGASAPTRMALADLDAALGAAMLTEGGREGPFVFDESDLSTKVSADAREGVYVAPLSDPSGASGAWVRKYSGAVNVRWFGATGNGTTDDGAAFTAAIALLKQLAGNPINGPIYKASSELFVPAGHYHLGTTTLDITHTLTIRGEGGLGFSASGGVATKLRWAANTTGIRIQSHITSGHDTVDAVQHFSGNGTQIKDLSLVGGRVDEATTPEGEYHGIHMKHGGYLSGVMVENFQGDGLHADCSVPEENSNCSRATNCQFNSCRNGRYMNGGDSNAWLFVGCQYNYNRRWGVFDTSFLGNSEIGAHTADNGITTDTPAHTVVSHLGNRYAVRHGQEAGASTNAPSGTVTDNAWWYYMAPGAPNPPSVPAWTSGIALRSGGAYAGLNFNASNMFVGCYSEGGQGPSQFTYPTMVDGGTLASGVKGEGSLAYNWQGWRRIGNGLRSAIFDGSVTINGITTINGGAASAALDLEGADAFPTINLKSAGTTNAYFMAAGSVGIVNGSNHLQLRAANAPTAYVQLEGLNLATGKNFQLDNVVVVDAARAATFTAVSSSGPIRSSSPNGGIGYSAGAGGAVTQATSKSTGVALNRPSGQITMHAAALAAGAIVTFTLTNSAIAAGDVLVLNHLSGGTPGAYGLNARTADGSASIDVRNNSGASLSQAIIISFALIKAATA